MPRSEYHWLASTAVVAGLSYANVPAIPGRISSGRSMTAVSGGVSGAVSTCRSIGETESRMRLSSASNFSGFDRRGLSAPRRLEFANAPKKISFSVGQRKSAAGLAVARELMSQLHEKTSGWEGLARWRAWLRATGRLGGDDREVPGDLRRRQCFAHSLPGTWTRATTERTCCSQICRTTIPGRRRRAG